MKTEKKLNVTMSYVRGLMLLGNPRLVAAHPNKVVRVSGPHAALKLYNRIQRAGREGVSLYRLVNNSRYHRWLVRAMVKAGLIMPKEQYA
ncbi:MAG: hypothetical protein ACYDHE_19685 [Candidatus Acidiferrales bacterium]